MPFAVQVLRPQADKHALTRADMNGNHSKVHVGIFNSRAADADDVLQFMGDGSGVFKLERNTDSGK